MSDKIISSIDRKPWEVKPLGCFLQTVLSFGVIGLAVAIFCGFMAAIAIPFGVFAPAPENGSGSPLRKLGLVVLWLGVLAATTLAVRVFSKLKTRFDYTSYSKKCSAGQEYFVGGSGMRRLHGPGSVRFDDGQMVLSGGLGPPLLGPFLIILVIDIFIVAATGFGLGLLGIAIALALYDSASRTDTSIAVHPSDIKKVSCDGSIVRIRFRQPPVEMLKAVTIVVTHDQDAFFFEFSRLFPDQLPPLYRYALIDLEELREAVPSFG